MQRILEKKEESSRRSKINIRNIYAYPAFSWNFYGEAEKILFYEFIILISKVDILERDAKKFSEKNGNKPLLIKINEQVYIYGQVGLTWKYQKIFIPQIEFIPFPDEEDQFIRYRMPPSIYKTLSYAHRLPSIDRLLSHLKVLAAITDQYHIALYCDEFEDGAPIKQQYKNHITRLLLPEFSLYTIQPLQMDEFELLIEGIETFAKNYHENVHLLFSSFAIKNTEGTILNMSIYVQCGIEYKINCFCKALATREDFDYMKYESLFCQVNHHFEIDELKLSKADCIFGQGIAVANEFLEVITTAGGMRYIQALEICIDHVEQYAKGKFNRLFDGSESIPLYGDHVISSNSIIVDEKALITETPVVQIDPYSKPEFAEQDSLSDKKSDYFQQRITRELKGHATTIMIRRNLNGVSILNSTFGSNMRLYVAEEVELKGFTKDLHEKVLQHNMRINLDSPRIKMQRKILLIQSIKNELNRLNVKYKIDGDSKARKAKIAKQRYEQLNKFLLKYQLVQPDFSDLSADLLQLKNNMKSTSFFRLGSVTGKGQLDKIIREDKEFMQQFNIKK